MPCQWLTSIPSVVPGNGVGSGVGVGVGVVVGVGVGVVEPDGVGVGAAWVVTVALNRPLAAYTAPTPYSVWTLVPLTAVIRYHDDPATAAAGTGRLPAAATDRGRDGHAGVDVDDALARSHRSTALVRRRTLQAAYLVTIGGATALNSFRAAYR